VRDGDRVVLLGAPGAWSRDALAASVRVSRRRGTLRADVVVAFCASLSQLERAAATIGNVITPDGMIWVAWPRRAAGHQSDLSDSAVRATMLAHGLVDVKVAMLDEDWSGLKFVWRVERRTALR
jgi:hypothetical protein